MANQPDKDELDISVLFEATTSFEQERPLSEGAKRRAELPLQNGRELNVFEAVAEKREEVRSVLKPLSNICSWPNPEE